MHIDEQKIKEDIIDWLVNYIECNHKFYDYKFPPCPFAKSVRLNNLLDIEPYTGGSISAFINDKTSKLIHNKTHNVCILVFPAYMKWNFYINYIIHSLNKNIIKDDFYAQYGTALKTSSIYPGLLNGKPYFIVIINKLSDVLSGHQSLLKTDYYDPWSKEHYHDVVVRRQKMVDKFRKK